MSIGVPKMRSMVSAPFCDDRPELLPVNGFGDDGATMTDETGDLLDAHPGVGQKTHETMTQLARGPFLVIETGTRGDRTERPTHVGRVQRASRTRGEDEVAVGPEQPGGPALLQLPAQMSGKGSDAPLWQARQRR